jgi:hypothetical protein
MIGLWNRFDALALETVDGFVLHLQNVFRIHYTTAVTVFCLGATIVSALAGLAVFQGRFEWMRTPAAIIWLVLIGYLVHRFRTSYWRDRRYWNEECEAYWSAFADGFRRRTAAWRPMLLILPTITSATAVFDLLAGRPLVALTTIVAHFLPFVPMLLIVYAMCAPPRPVIR